MNEVIRLALEVSIQSTTLALCIGVLLAAARIRSGSVCHAAWLAVLCAMILMPALSQLTPAVGLPVALPLAANELDGAMPELAPTLTTRSATEPTPPKMRSSGAIHNVTARVETGAAWPMVISGVYGAGLAFLLACVAAGWRTAMRIARVAEPVRLSVPGAQVCESALVTTPLTMGILSPRIVLPVSWHGWPAGKLHAVLAHEAAHVRQRHVLVSLVAHLNRCIFWFHPLAWWLERKLAITAEHACDEAAVRAIGQSREYAQVLLEMAGTVLRQGGRFSLAGVGIHGAGPLEQRIDHILRHDATQRVSRTRRAIVAAGCAAAIFAVAACRQQPAAVSAPSAENQGADQRAELMAEVKALMKFRWNAENQAAQTRLADIRRKLDQSTDVQLLLSTATPMVSMCWPTNTGPAAGMEVFAAGKATIERALQLDPKSTWARQLENKIRDQELVVSLPEKIWSGPLESRRQAIQALPAGERFRELSILAISAGDEAVRTRVINHDPAGEKAAWEQAGRYAQEALEVSPQARDHADFGTSLFRANMVAGMAALAGGDKKAAAEFARKAVDAPVTEALQYPIPNARPWPMNWQFPKILAAAMLREGERDVVVDFLERYSRIVIADKDRWLSDIALIRQGKLPAWARS